MYHYLVLERMEIGVGADGACVPRALYHINISIIYLSRVSVSPSLCHLSSLVFVPAQTSMFSRVVNPYVDLLVHIRHI